MYMVAKKSLRDERGGVSKLKESPCHVVPSSGEEGSGVVAIKHGLTNIKPLIMNRL